MRKFLHYTLTFLMISSIFAGSGFAQDYVKRIKKNKTTFSFLAPFMLHPSRVGVRDQDQLFFPKNYSSKKKWPLVVLLHGIYVSGKFQDHFFSLKKQVTKKGFVLLIPGSTYDQRGMRFWNSSNTCCDFYNSGVDDLSYLSNLITKVKAENSIDPDHVSVIGHSNGAMMAQRLGCDSENLVTRVVSFAGILDAHFSCKNKGHLKVTLIHSTRDDHILFNGMSDEELNYRIDHHELAPLRGKYIGAVENFNLWKSILPEGSVELQVTNTKGHMPKLSREEKDQLVDLLIGNQ